MSLNQLIHEKLVKRLETNALRVLYPDVKGIDFWSNDYLGLNRSQTLISEVEHLVSTCSEMGGTGSRLISGNSSYIENLEYQIAQIHQTESALFYTSGYSANIGLLSALGDRSVCFIYDELSHASIRDGIRLSTAHSVKFKHNDLADLEKKLINHSHSHPVVLVESIYSMDGDLAELEAISLLCEKYGADLIVDEAHALGVLGVGGEGLVQKLKLENKVFARVFTYGKAMGAHGSAIVGSNELKQFLINYSRSFIYTTAPSLHQVFQIQVGYKLLKQVFIEDWFKEKVSCFQEQLKDVFNVLDSVTPIQGILIPSNEKISSLENDLRKEGFLVKAIKSPTVPIGSERLRICLHKYNTLADITLLTTQLKLWAKKYL